MTAVCAVLLAPGAALAGLPDVATASPAAKAVAPAASAAGPVANADPASACKLPNRSFLSEGIPSDWNQFPKPVGPRRAAVLFRGSWDMDAEISRLRPAEQLYRSSSYGRYQLQLVPHRSPVAMSGTAASEPERADMVGDVVVSSDSASVWGDAARRADPYFDFSDIDIVFLIDRYTSRSYAQPDNVTLDGKTIKVGAVIGTDWPYHRHKLLAHEGGHTISLPDLYGGAGGHQYVGGWDLMGNLGGPSPDHFGWHKWKLGWLDDNQVSCLATSDATLEQPLTPIELAGGMKTLVVRYGDTRAYVAEVRTRNGLNSASCDTGVLIYSVDSAVNSGSGPVRVKDARPGSGGCSGHELNDGAYDAGQSFVDSVNQVRIDVVSQDGENYLVRASLGQSGGGGSAFNLVGAGSGKCVDVPSASQTDGTGLIIYTCHSNSNQRWTATSAGELRVYNNTKCMDSVDGANGARVVIDSCDGTSSQKWMFQSNGAVTNGAAGRCLDVNGGGAADNTAVIVWDCHGGSNQRWTRQP